MPLRIRELTEGELEAVRRLAIARTLHRSFPTVRLWLERFNTHGLSGLQDAPRGGRPHQYTPEQVGQVIELALTDPDTLDLPFGCWTLDRLQYYANEVLGIPIKRARIGEVLLAEGLRWRSQETWFGERVDPAFAEKRGPSSASTPSRRPAAWSSASTSWGPKRRRVSGGGA